MLKHEFSHLPDTIERLNKLEKITERASSLVSELMTFSRKEKLIKQVMSYSSLIEETKGLGELLVPKKVSLNWKVNKHVNINGNASQVQQIILNLLKNASDAVADVEHPTISITLSTVEMDLQLSQRSDLKVGEQFAMLSVSDNGSGIKDAHKESIFDPFFTTKGVGEGTGMGLAMIYGSIQNHGGHIEFESKQNLGTEFKLYIPIVSNTDTYCTSTEKNVSNILLVDDDLLMLEVGAEVLKSLGYQVITCDNGEDAVNLFREQGDTFSLAVLDVMMPYQNGTETAVQLRQIRPDLPILFATGYDKNAVSEDILSEPKTCLISKPWKVEVFDSTIQSLINDTTDETIQ